MITVPDFRVKQIVFVFINEGEKISFKNDNLVVLDKNGKIKLQTSGYRLFALFIVGHITLTSYVLYKTEKFGFNVILMSYGFKPYMLLSYKAKGNTLLNKRQYRYQDNEIAKHLVFNKISNQIGVLKNIRNKDQDLLKVISDLENYNQSLYGNKVESLYDILGIEGIASKSYFNILFKDYNWQGRKPRVKNDPINSLLDIGYTLLFSLVESLLNAYGFDNYQGVYHREFYNRKSLVCDLVEPFRPLIDRRIRKAYRLNQVRKADFTIINQQYKLFGDNSKKYVKILLDELLKYKINIFVYIQQYYRAFIRGKSIKEYPVFNINDEIIV